MSVVTCSICGMRVEPSEDGTCPSCHETIVVAQPWWEQPRPTPAKVTLSPVRPGGIPLEEAVRQGKRLTLISYSLLISGSLFSEGAIFFSEGRIEPLGTTLCLLNALLCYLTFHGKRWSRYVAGTVNGYLAFMVLSGSVRSVTESPSPAADWSGVGIMIIALFAAAWLGIPAAILAFSTRVGAFIASRTHNRQVSNRTEA